ncbi:SPEG isoform 26 [Pan troglodytes]|uniref:Aortic preferentially expressed gene 1, isoform CRA_i n=2 Tax=Homininae TaxID=207598 RepID=G5E9J7_HUMAN|nr:aortic preferentially expressed gene 1, isoform CRA_i [Homo sapiens]PNI70687.1 SPEG isoform 25 [Pan troglodytes]KAI2527133.1 striated muscle enriched protein kinase [Homo sapiens]KAI2527134.1 striated muscle enriched protein kinase [Homo sapiens]KAI4038287.1 striated muscle enriched protein kinase [Homo sapiens]
MKKLWVKKRFQKTGHSRRAFGRLTHGAWTVGVLALAHAYSSSWSLSLCEASSS